MSLSITLNGGARRVDVETALELVESLGLTPESVLIEHNRVVVPRDRWAEAQLAEGDRIEIIQMIAGG